MYWKLTNNIVSVDHPLSYLKFERSLLIFKNSKTESMAFLKEDSVYTHVIAIDFGTGASG